MAISQRVTIKHVAKEAGVSIQTVSRVINRRPDVSPETRKKVLQIIERLGYSPSALARSLIQRRSYTLGVVTAGLKYIGPARTLNGITHQAQELGYALLLHELPSFNTNNITPLLQSLLSRHIDGIIWAAPEIGDNRAWLEEHIPTPPIPMIFLTMQKRPGVPIVSFDNQMGGRMATRHLIEEGCKRIGHLSGPLDWWEARQRKEGWQQTLTEAGFQVNDQHWSEGNWSSNSGEKAFRQLLATYPDMEAVFVANDQMALSVLQIACQQGIRVPQDLAVVGFDGIAESAYFWPPLTTVYQDQHSLGCKVVEELVKNIELIKGEEEPKEPQSIYLNPELIVRESSSLKDTHGLKK
jgi:LacI family transcriptional regulator